VTPTESQQLRAIDLTQSQPEIRVPPARPSVVERLRSQGILPAGHESIAPAVLVLVEQIFVTWYELDNDRTRKLALHTLIGTEWELRATLLAIVPLYFDPYYFDHETPTSDLVELALVAHKKWRMALEIAQRARPKS
jgi:hypothetical protein